MIITEIQYFFSKIIRFQAIFKDTVEFTCALEFKISSQHIKINNYFIEKNAPNTESIGILYPVRCRLFNLSDSNVHTHYNLDAW